MRRNDPRLGIVLLLVSTAVVLLALVAIARYPSLFRRGREYRATFHSVAGLNPGDEVRFGGLLVGAVTDMELDPGERTRILVRFKVRPSTPVRTDTRAVITQVGLLGEPYLNLEPGRPDSPVLPDGSMLASSETMSFQGAVERIARFLDRADTLMGGLQRVSEAEPWERIDRTLTRFDRLVENTGAGSDRLLRQLDVASRQLARVLDHTERLVVTLDTTVRTTGPGLAETQREALSAIRDVHTLVADLRDALDAGGGVDQLVRNLSVVSDNMARLSTRIERDPSSILRRREERRKPAGPGIR